MKQIAVDARLAGRRIVITGAGSGIGRATTLRLLREGATVAASSLTEENLMETQRLAAEAGLESELIVSRTFDVSKEDEVTAAIPQMIEELGGIDVLINGAGVLQASHTQEMNLDFWNRIIQTNLTGTFLVTRESLPYLLKEAQPVVINFSSTTASFAQPYLSAYSASKGGIKAFTHSVALEYSKQGLRAVCIAPGSIHTPMTLNPGLPKDADLGLLLSRQPAIRPSSNGILAPPERVSGVVAMLASEDAAFITGTEIVIDGGTHM